VIRFIYMISIDGGLTINGNNTTMAFEEEEVA
jgi:hypothetical protein